MGYKISRSLEYDDLEKFIFQCVDVFEDIRLDTRPGMSSVFMHILSDLSTFAPESFQAELESINSYKKMEIFTKDVWEKFKHGEEIFGIKYKLITENEVGYRSAIDRISLKHKDIVLGTDSSQNIDTTLLDFERPVAEIDNNVLVVLK